MGSATSRSAQMVSRILEPWPEQERLNDILRTIPKKKAPNMNVAVDVDADRFTQLFADRITGGR